MTTPYLAPTYFPPAYFAGAYWGSSAMPSDLLSAILDHLKAAPTVLAVVPAASIHAFLAPAGLAAPFVVVDQFMEVLPGETEEDAQVDGTVIVVGSSRDEARQVGAAIRNALDSPNINPNAVTRDPFAWVGFKETAVLRNNTRVEKLPGLARGGGYLYIDETDYVFYVTPTA